MSKVAAGASFWRWYSDRLKTHPYTTNMMSSCLVGGVGDTIAQTAARYVTHSPSTLPRKAEAKDAATRESALVFDHPTTGLHDVRRTLLFMTYFGTIGAPVMLFMFRTIQRCIPAWTLSTAIQKGFWTWMTGFISSPVLITYVTVTEAAFLHGLSPSEALANVQNNLAKEIYEDVPLLQKYRLMYYMCHWVPQFYYTPVHFRMLYATCALMGWTAISSSILHHETRRQQQQQQQHNLEQQGLDRVKNDTRCSAENWAVEVATTSD